jgi:hypothetical protein
MKKPTGPTTPNKNRFSLPSGVRLLPSDDPLFTRSYVIGGTKLPRNPESSRPQSKPEQGSEAPTSSDPVKLEAWLKTQEPRREDFQDEESYLEALDGFKHRTKHLWQAIARHKASKTSQQK